VGNFPPGWSEWNGRYRDTMRDYWRGENARLADFAFRFTGSSDLYEPNGRRPSASINFITAHDGFTLNDLVSYNEKHNEANGENNADGESFNRSWNCGAEGETDDPGIRALRERQQRNFLTTLMLAQGVPMILAGDEVSHSQQGNNNAYCQDNHVSWYDWGLRDKNLVHFGFTRRLLDIRKRHPVFRRRKWFQGRPVHGTEISDISWLRPDGTEMSDEEWGHVFSKSLGVFLNGHSLPDPGPRGERIDDDDFLLFFNAHHEPVEFTVPAQGREKSWGVVIDTDEPCLEEDVRVHQRGDRVRVQSRSIAVLRTLPEQ
jgi:isoamylase